MKYTLHIVDVFGSTPFGGNQLAVLPDAAGISTEGMQEIAREFNFGETTFVLPKKDPANTCRVRIFTPRAELDFAGRPTVGTACALVMKQHVRLSDPIRLILEENIGPVTVDVARRNGGFHGTLTLTERIEAPSGAPSPTELAAVLSVEPAEVSQVFFASAGVPFCFAQLSSNEVVDRATINRAACCQRGELSVRGLARTGLKRVAIHTNVNDVFNEFDRPATQSGQNHDLTQVSREAATGDVR
jgi:trans-2,3-dihydro-3-hydroxyanthranilate isomerase